MDAVEIRTIAKVTKRLVPFLIVCYFIAYLDRVNVGFAALEMNQDLGLSQTAFGLGAGIFFIAYFIFEVPSNLLLERFGARKWIARIMLSWGVLSGTMAFIPAIAHATGLGNENSFYLLRVLLGAAEAGFFPGIIFYLTLWFPAQYRARIVGYFMAAIPLSTVIGAPISAIFFICMAASVSLAGSGCSSSRPCRLLYSLGWYSSISPIDLQTQHGSHRKNASGSPANWNLSSANVRQCVTTQCDKR
jgi:MFS family permease